MSQRVKRTQAAGRKSFTGGAHLLPLTPDYPDRIVSPLHSPLRDENGDRVAESQSSWLGEEGPVITGSCPQGGDAWPDRGGLVHEDESIGEVPTSQNLLSSEAVPQREPFKALCQTKQHPISTASQLQDTTAKSGGP